MIKSRILAAVLFFVSALLLVTVYQNCGEQSGFRSRPLGMLGASIGGPGNTTTTQPQGGGGGGTSFLSQIRVGTVLTYSTRIVDGSTCNGTATYTVISITGQTPNRTYKLRERYICGVTYPDLDIDITEAQMRPAVITDCAAEQGTPQTIPGIGGAMTLTCYFAVEPNPNPPPDDLFLWLADVPRGFVRIVFAFDDGYRETLNLTNISF